MTDIKVNNKYDVQKYKQYSEGSVILQVSNCVCAPRQLDGIGPRHIIFLCIILGKRRPKWSGLFLRTTIK